MSKSRKKYDKNDLYLENRNNVKGLKKERKEKRNNQFFIVDDLEEEDIELLNKLNGVKNIKLNKEN